MKRLYLASSIDRTAKSIAKDIGGNTKKLRLVFITTASEEEDPPYDWQDADRKGLIDAGFDLFDYTITGKNKSQIEKDLEGVGVIHVNGGNDFYLALQRQKSGFDSVILNHIKSGGIYIGSSAGSIMVGPDIEIMKGIEDESVAEGLKNYKGLGLVSFTIFPHWGSSNFRKSYMETRLEQVYKDKYQIILLTNYQYVKVEGDMYKIVDARDEI